jgi:AraC family transcriptional regulator
MPNRKNGRAPDTGKRLTGAATEDKTMKAALENYHARMQRVLAYIDRHLDDDLDLEAVSAVAAFSKYHFQRQFTATFGLSVHRYVQLIRMKRASYRLAYRDAQSVTDIAMDAGYDAPDAFARAFRQRFAQSPSSFRKSPDWEPWLAAFGPLENVRSKRMQKIFTPDDVTIRDAAPTPVAIMKHRGDPATIVATIQRFIAWRKATGLSPKTSTTFNIFHSDTRNTAPSEYRMDLCVGTDRPIEAHGARIEAGMIPGGRCAVLRVVGNTDNLEAAALYLYRDWLPVSGEEARDFPLYCQRLAFFPDVPEHEAIAEVFLPLQ